MAEIGEGVPQLGFGLMRIPEIEVDGKMAVDIDQTIEMVDIYMNAGMNYFDTAFGYMNGRNEKAIKEVLTKRYPREDFILATKLPAWLMDEAEKAKSMFPKSLERMGVDYVDYYLLHNMGEHRTKVFEDFGIWDFVMEQKEKGLIKHIGFSMHAKSDELREILTAHPEVEFVQLQINWADWENDTIESRKCYEVAREFNKPIVIMEPVRGGSLANLPAPVAKVFEEANPEASQASWALRFVAELPGVMTILSGMSTPEQVRENVELFQNMKPLSAEEKQVIVKAQEELAKLPNVPCTDCKYCVDECPEGVLIPQAFTCMNIYLTYNNLTSAKEQYSWMTAAGRASACTACGSCEAVCPQSIEIIDELEKVAEALEA